MTTERDRRRELRVSPSSDAFVRTAATLSGVPLETLVEQSAVDRAERIPAKLLEEARRIREPAPAAGRSLPRVASTMALPGDDDGAGRGGL